MSSIKAEDLKRDDKNFNDLNLSEIISIFKTYISYIIIVPIVFALFVYLFSDFLPKIYKSTIVIHEKSGAVGVEVPYQELNGAFIAALFKLDSVLDEAILQLKEKDSSYSLNRSLLLQKISTIVARNEKLVFISIHEKSAEDAKLVADTMLQIVMYRTKPAGLDKIRIEKKITDAREQIERINAYTNMQMNGLSKNKENNVEVVLGIATLDKFMEMKTEYENKVNLYENVLRGLSVDDLIQAPVISQTPVSPNKKFLMLTSWAASLIGCVLFAYFRSSRKLSMVAGKDI